MVSMIQSYSILAQQLLINEFMASNKDIIRDNYDESSDWIEIYNNSESIINLSQFFITDDSNNKQKCVLPEVFLEPSDFILLWASGQEQKYIKTDWPFTIELESAGYEDGNKSLIWINNENKSLNIRGINIVSISPDGTEIESKNFDTYISSEDSDSLVSFIMSQQIGQILVFSIRDEGNQCLTDSARSYLFKLGSKAIKKLGFRDAWGMIVVLGTGVINECYRERGHGSANSIIPSLHLNFKLDKEGEYIGVSNFQGQVIDSITYSLQLTNHSLGRYLDGARNWFYFSSPTPGSPNINSIPLKGVLTPPIITPPGGIYTDSIVLTINHTNLDEQIYYTLYGSEPSENATLYDGKSIIINENSILNAYSVKEGYIDSEIITNTYLFEIEPSLPVLSISTNPKNLWDTDIGIYVVGNDSLKPNYMMRGSEWERSANFSLFSSDGSSILKTNCGLRVHGGFSRYFPKKSLRVYFSDNINLFGSNYQQINQLVILSGANDSVSDFRESLKNSWSLIRDNLMINLFSLIDGDYVGKFPVLLFLNGENWGIYTLSERINEDFLKVNLGIMNGELIRNNVEPIVGNLNYWTETINFFKNADLSDKENYKKAKDIIDIENFTNYYFINLFSGNNDWPFHNIYSYRNKDSFSKWRWLMWDADFTFWSPENNDPSFNNLRVLIEKKENNEIFYSIIRNNSYREFFCNRCMDILNHTLKEDVIISIIDSLSSIIESDIEFEIQKWSGSKLHWFENIKKMKEFASKRPTSFRKIISKELNAGKEVKVKVENTNVSEGIIAINGYKIYEYPYTGIYFSNIPIKIEAIPNQGFYFKEWGNKNLKNNSSFITTVSASLNLNINFVSIDNFPKSYKLYQNYPNPFTSSTKIDFYLLNTPSVIFKIYNIKGELIKTIFKNNLISGFNSIYWDGKDDLGNNVSSGIYFYSLEVDNFKYSKKIILIR
jgi:hypothetical protein